MPPLTHRRKVAALSLAAALALPWTAAAAPQARHQPVAPGLVQQLWTALTAFWGAGVSPDSGCKMDPNGACLPGSAFVAPTITRDSGCKWDPNGACLPGSALPEPTITRDSGCSMDPNGGCLPGS